MLSSQLQMLDSEDLSIQVENDVSPESFSSSRPGTFTEADERENDQSENKIDDCSQDNYLPEDAASISLTCSFNLSQIDLQDGDQKSLENQVIELVAANNALETSLKHSRKRCRELLKDLREERAKKILRGDDFKMIHKILNKYI